MPEFDQPRVGVPQSQFDDAQMEALRLANQRRGTENWNNLIDILSLAITPKQARLIARTYDRNDRAYLSEPSTRPDYDELL